DAASVEQQLARLAFEPFIDLDAAGKPVPALLDTIPSRANGGLSADGRTIVYRLRPGVRWSDGVPVTSGDVLFTLHAILDPRNPVRSHEGYDLIDDARARDARTVVVHLRRAWAPAVMTYFSYGFSPQFVLPEHVLRAQSPLARAPFNDDPSVGDGPYRFVSWRRGDALHYTANQRYWAGAPAIARLDVRVAPDPSTNLVMLQSGTLDWNLIAPVQMAILRGKPGLSFVKVPTAVVAGLALNTAHAPLDDVRFRQALAMSIDRVSISRKITLGVYPVTDTIQPHFSWAYDPSVREPAYDPGGADRVFDALGYTRGADGMRRKKGTPLQLLYVQFPESMTGVRVSATVQAELKDRGIDVSIKSTSNAQLFLPRTGTLATGTFDLAYVPWTMGADPDDSAVFRCGGASNYMRWCDPRIDELETQALASTEPATRRTLYARIARIVARQVPIVFLFNANYVYAYRDRLRGFAPNAFLPTWNAAAWSLRGD
ncbi:MAG: peptide ABC transporter substrate-binding protein, partial [Candidatus Eremiobacteraeota bacterium]|nr:peptide ABC transporter substrate-binding protein [Candidatus Eremiobacteraeota bacterium]